MVRRQRVVDRDVDDLRQRLALEPGHLLADAVVDDDGVVDRVAEDRQQHGDRR